jgi:hypothetical protein
MRFSPLAALFAAAIVPAAAAFAAPAERGAQQCFYTHDWKGWCAADRDGTAMYLRVGISKIYRVDFAGTCPELSSPGARLITESTFGRVCSGIDLTVKVTDSSGRFPTPCIVKSVSPLTQAEASQLPKTLRP